MSFAAAKGLSHILPPTRAACIDQLTPEEHRAAMEYLHAPSGVRELLFGKATNVFAVQACNSRARLQVSSALKKLDMSV
jgi:hypothetical protein